MKYVLYGNGGSGNHGCEAIVRGTKALLEEELILSSSNPIEDKKYGLDNLVRIIPALTKKQINFRFLYAYLKMKITGDYKELDFVEYLPTIKKMKKETKVALSVGGDNYCYKGTEIYPYLNRGYHQQGFKTVLWGCSVEPEVVQETEIAKDLRSYELIVARESITYEALMEIGAKAILAPDPAFFMKAVPCKVDSRLERDNVVGINVSPMILKCAKDSSVAYESFVKLLQYILEETDATIALIPHVVWEKNDDRKVLQKLYEDTGRSDRVVVIEDHTAPELKYIISKCKIFIGARTHATIAAYSNCIPTIVVGYSVKARGIARDLFGTEEKYVIPVQEIKDVNELADTFKWFWENSEEIKKYLKNIVPQYISKGYEVKNQMETILK